MNNTRRVLCKRCALGTVLALLGACGKREEGPYQPSASPGNPQANAEYVVGIHPLHNPQKLMDLYGPIVDHINNQAGVTRFRLEASRNYEEFEKKLDDGRFAFAMPNPYQTVSSLQHGYRIFGKMGDDEVFRGIILVRRDSGIRTVTDLKGKSVAYPAASALAATMLPQYFLHTHGLDVNRDIKNIYVGSQESAIENVLRGHVAAAATWPVPWELYTAEHPELARELEVKWQTAPLVNNGWVVRNDIPLPVAERFAEALFGLQASPHGRAILARLPISRFEPANNETYLPVREFLATFSKTVRAIEQ